ncbi:MAG: lysophospholipid acyltransferase family protein [Pseudomonadales bacterium]|jgi:KDO2-lipid IV(A) lauroyltransferase|nr:lysophospholipid acyltransferase family protein [Pseudomonadales bacterium]
MAKLYFLPRALLKDRDGMLRLGWRLEALVVRGFFALLRSLPRSWATEVGRWLFATIGPFTGVNAKLLRNLAVMHPEDDMASLERRAKRSFGWLGVAIAELAQLREIVAKRDTLVEFEVDPSVAALLKDPRRPAVMVTAHVGPWTLTNLVGAHFGFRLTTVYAPESNPHVGASIREIRAALPMRFIERDGSMRKLMRELAEGHKIGLASDVRLDTGDPVPFFGHAMATNTVPVRLALRYGCPLVPVRAERLPGGRFRITIEAAIEATDPDAELESRVLQMATALSSVYERWIRQSPDQWMCMARRWPKDVELGALARAEARR